jgi:hypothetical protein
MPLTDAQIERYSRQIIVPRIGGRAQERLLSAKMLLAGEAQQVEQSLAYLVGAGVGSIRLAMSQSDRSAFDRLKKSMRELNPDVTTQLDDASQQPIDVALLIIGSDVARDLADRRCTGTNLRACVVARLDQPAKIAVLTSPSSCPRCADASLLAPVGARVADADFVAMLATAEAFKLLAGYHENPLSVIIDFDGHQTRSRAVTSPCTCPNNPR